PWDALRDAYGMGSPGQIDLDVANLQQNVSRIRSICGSFD
ncbi:unnamed protein product, partial [marine sediment metagenome]